MIKVYLVKGSGFAGFVEVPEGTQLATFFSGQVGGNPEDYTIKVNRDVQPPEYVLQEKDRVTVTPAKIEGA